MQFLYDDDDDDDLNNSPSAFGCPPCHLQCPHGRRGCILDSSTAQYKHQELYLKWKNENPEREFQWRLNGNASDRPPLCPDCNYMVESTDRKCWHRDYELKKWRKLDYEAWLAWRDRLEEFLEAEKVSKGDCSIVNDLTQQQEPDIQHDNGGGGEVLIDMTQEEHHVHEISHFNGKNAVGINLLQLSEQDNHVREFRTIERFFPTSIHRKRVQRAVQLF